MHTPPHMAHSITGMGNLGKYLTKYTTLEVTGVQLRILSMSTNEYLMRSLNTGC